MLVTHCHIITQHAFTANRIAEFDMGVGSWALHFASSARVVRKVLPKNDDKKLPNVFAKSIKTCSCEDLPLWQLKPFSVVFEGVGSAVHVRL